MSIEEDDQFPVSTAERQALLIKYARLLRVHFDSVQVIATRIDPKTDSTMLQSIGYGNWFGRLGSVRSWLVDAEGSLEDVDNPKEES